MTSYTQYMAGLTANTTSRAASPLIWADFPYWHPFHMGSEGAAFFDDFSGSTAELASVTNADYFVGVDTGGTILSLTGEAGATGQDSAIGMFKIDGDGTAQDGVVVAHPVIAGVGNATDGDQAGMFRANGSTDKCYFEARIKVDSVADQGQSFFIGLAEGSDILANATLVDTSHILDADKSFIGFHTLPADGDAMLPVYQEGGAAVSDGTGVTIVADTWYKVGFKIAGNVAKWYVDGVEKREVTISSAINWPDAGDMLSLVCATKVGTGAAAVEMDCDWWKAGWVV